MGMATKPRPKGLSFLLFSYRYGQAGQDGGGRMGKRATNQWEKWGGVEAGGGHGGAVATGRERHGGEEK